MRITLIGSGTIVPSSKRFSSGILVELEHDVLLFDIGPGILEKLKNRGIDPNSIGYLFITHYHIDHVIDYLPLVKLRAFNKVGHANPRPLKLNVYGPPGLKKFSEIVFSNIPQFDYLSKKFNCFSYVKVNEVWDGEVVRVKDWVVSCKPVKHYEGVAYRVDYRGKSIVYSGDTIPDNNLINLAKGCDVLIHECSFPDDMTLGLHTSASQLVEVVSKVGPKKLVVTHMYPAWEGREEELLEILRSGYRNEIILGEDGSVVEV